MDWLGICNHHKSEWLTKKAAKTFPLRLIQRTLTHLGRKKHSKGELHIAKTKSITVLSFFPTFQWDFFLQGMFFGTSKNHGKKDISIPPAWDQASVLRLEVFDVSWVKKPSQLLRGILGEHVQPGGKDHWVTCSKLVGGFSPTHLKNMSQNRFIFPNVRLKMKKCLKPPTSKIWA